MVVATGRPAATRGQPRSSALYTSAVITKPMTVDFQAMVVPELDTGQVLVKLQGCGLCASNIPLWEGRDWFHYPLQPGAPGHEGWGVIEAVGPSVAGVAPGQRVAVLNERAFAEYVVVHSRDAIVIPESLEDLPFPGEPFGCAFNIFARSAIAEGQVVAIIGMGFLGLALVSLAKRRGATVITLSRRERALRTASQLGADLTIKLDEHQRVLDQVNDYTAGAGCERVIECTGMQWPLDLAGNVIKTYGRLVIAGYHQDGPRQIDLQQWNWKGIDVVNAHERDPDRQRKGIAAALDAIQNGWLDPRQLLTHAFRFSDMGNAFEQLRSGPQDYVKGYLKF